MSVTIRRSALLTLALVSACADHVSPPPVLRSADVRPTSAIAAGKGIWSKRAGMKTARYNAMTATVGDYLFVMGGQGSGGDVLESVERYNTVTRTWASRKEMPAERYGASTVSIGDKIYVFGGVSASGNVTNSTLIYSASTNSWSEGADMPAGRWRAGAMVLNGVAPLVMGGSSDLEGTGTTTVWIYHLDEDAWSDAAALTTPASEQIVAKVGTEIWRTNGVETTRYSEAFGTMTPYSDAVIPGSGGAMVNGVLFVVRTSMGGIPVRALVSTSGSTMNWVSMAAPPPLRIPQVNTAVGAAGGFVFVAGGSVGEVPTNELWAFDPDFGNHAPVPLMDAPWNDMYEGGTYDFSGAAAYDPDGDAITYWWYWDDAVSSSNASPWRYMPDDGEITVSLTVDDGAVSRTASRTFTVKNRAPQVTFPASPVDSIMQFEGYYGIALINDPGNNTWTGLVDYGIGEGWVPVDGITSNQASLSHSMPLGRRVVKVKITDDKGAEGVGKQEVLVLTVERSLSAMVNKIEENVSSVGPRTYLLKLVREARRQALASNYLGAYFTLQDVSYKIEQMNGLGRFSEPQYSMLSNWLSRVTNTVFAILIS